MSIKLVPYRNIVSVEEAQKTIEIVAAYFEKEKVWVFNTWILNKPNLQHVKDLFINQFNPTKVIYLKLSLYSLCNYLTRVPPKLGPEPTLKNLFKEFKNLFWEENADGLAEIAKLVGEEFDKEAFIREARRREIEDLFESIADLDVPLPEKLKKTDPFNYAKLRLLRLQKIQDALEQLNVQPKEVSGVEG